MRRLAALVVKEFLQIRRDFSSLLLACFIPWLMVVFYGLCINQDSPFTTLALVLEDEAPAAHSLTDRLQGSPAYRARRVADRAEALDLLRRGEVQAALFVPCDFSKKLLCGQGPKLLLATDAATPNTAQFSAAYLQALCTRWAEDRGVAWAGIATLPSYRFNPSATSRHYILPGAIAVVLSFVGSFLTAMVVAREWERGTIEGLLASPATRTEFVSAKLIPYFLLGMVAMAVCMVTAHGVFGVPVRSPLWMPLAAAAVFLLSVLSIGLIISSAVRNQYSASLLAFSISLLPTMLLSGLVFEVSSMPVWMQHLSRVIPASFFVPSLTTLMLAGPVVQVVAGDLLALALSAVVWLLLVHAVTPRRLDS